MSDPTIFHVDRLELAFAPRTWAFADERSAEIDAYFAELQREKPAIWNGRVLLLHHQVVSKGVLYGKFLETDFAGFAAWRHWGRPRAGVRDCFAAAAVLSADGAFMLGVMGAHTANAGHVYFPCGTPDRSDVVGATVDFDVSVRRELKEETGLRVEDFTLEPGWTTVVDGAQIAQIKVMRSAEDAETLRARMLAHLASETQPELSDIRIVRGLADIDPAMQGFVVAFLQHRLTAAMPGL
ncbi:MAG: NUDIX hydrolase [Pseudolabrys sp.]|nr:NUDIX hydrolase [Pseudolabrys sp.]